MDEKTMLENFETKLSEHSESMKTLKEGIDKDINGKLESVSKVSEELKESNVTIKKSLEDVTLILESFKAELKTLTEASKEEPEDDKDSKKKPEDTKEESNDSDMKKEKAFKAMAKELGYDVSKKQEKKESEEPEKPKEESIKDEPKEESVKSEDETKKESEAKEEPESPKSEKAHDLPVEKGVTKASFSEVSNSPKFGQLINEALK